MAGGSRYRDAAARSARINWFRNQFPQLVLEPVLFSERDRRERELFEGVNRLLSMDTEMTRLSDEELMSRLDGLAARGRRNLRALLWHLAEFDRRRLAILKGGAPSTFQYCVARLGFSEDEAYKRIQAARAAAQWPVILDLLEAGAVNLTAVTLLRPHLENDNHRVLLERACGKSKFEIQRMIAVLAPRPDGPDVIRHMTRSDSLPGIAHEDALDAKRELPLPAPIAGLASDPGPVDSHALGAEEILPTPPARQQSVIPTAPERIRFSFTGSEKLLALLRRAQDVLRHKFPAGDLELVFLEALEALLDRRDPGRRLKAKEEKRAESGRPAPQPPEEWDSRRVPQSVKDEVWRRDGGQCVYQEPGGERCPERGGLEFDHVIPFALGGPSNNAKNIRLLCKAHNRSLAARTFGDFSAWRWRTRLDKPASSGPSAS